jgi:hypothetical protein
MVAWRAAMISIGIAVGAGLFFWLHMYKWAFWILVYAIANGALAAIYAVINPGWYYSRVLSEGVMPNYTYLFISKGIIIAILVPIAWYVGVLAGYIGN